MKSYESSKVTLRAILAHPSLQRESIDATMDALAEANADAREVDDAVRVGGDVATGVADVADEDGLEEELRNLIEEAEKEKANVDHARQVEETRKRLEQISNEVPSTLPGMAIGEKSKVAITS
jgi:charged multivesicular body protein 7